MKTVIGVGVLASAFVLALTGARPAGSQTPSPAPPKYPDLPGSAFSGVSLGKSGYLACANA